MNTERAQVATMRRRSSVDYLLEDGGESAARNVLHKVMGWMGDRNHTEPGDVLAYQLIADPGTYQKAMLNLPAAYVCPDEDELARDAATMTDEERAAVDALPVASDDPAAVKTFECQNLQCGAVFIYGRRSCGTFAPPRFCPDCGRRM